MRRKAIALLHCALLIVCCGFIVRAVVAACPEEKARQRQCLVSDDECENRGVFEACWKVGPAEYSEVGTFGCETNNEVQTECIDHATSEALCYKEWSCQVVEGKCEKKLFLRNVPRLIKTTDGC